MADERRDTAVVRTEPIALSVHAKRPDEYRALEDAECHRLESTSGIRSTLCLAARICKRTKIKEKYCDPHQHP
jgi:hypothetical protein